MLKLAAEPKQVKKKQIHQFVGVDDFVEKLNRKVQWTVDNLEEVIAPLKSESIPVGKPVSVNSVFITFEPLFAFYHLPRHPVVSIAEFVHDFSASGKWPYSYGLRVLP